MNNNKLNNESRLIIQNQDFSNESSLTQYIKYEALARISFINCNFKEIDLMGKVFGKCNFIGCTFNHLNSRKGIISGCHFRDCTITNSDMTRVNFDKSTFINCEFINVDLAASDFCECKLKKTKFLKSNLNFIGLEDVKVWKSKEKEWVEIDNFFNL